MWLTHICPSETTEDVGKTGRRWRSSRGRALRKTRSPFNYVLLQTNVATLHRSCRFYSTWCSPTSTNRTAPCSGPPAPPPSSSVTRAPPGRSTSPAGRSRRRSRLPGRLRGGGGCPSSYHTWAVPYDSIWHPPHRGKIRPTPHSKPAAATPPPPPYIEKFF